MTFGSAALRARPEGFLELLPPLPVDILEAAFRAEIALARGPQATVVANESDLVGRLACPETNSEHAAVSSCPIDRVPVSFNHDSAKEFVSNIIEAQFGQHRSKAKAVAKHTAGTASPRTVETWTKKQSAPSLAAFLNMLVGPEPIPALQAEVRRMLEMDASLNPEMGRAISELVRVAQAGKP